MVVIKCFYKYAVQHIFNDNVALFTEKSAYFSDSLTYFHYYCNYYAGKMQSL